MLLTEEEIFRIVEYSNVITKNLLKQNESSNSNSLGKIHIHANSSKVFKKQEFKNNIEFISNILLTIKDFIINYKENVRNQIIYDLLNVELYCKINVFSKEFDNEINEILFNLFTLDDYVQNEKITGIFLKCLKLMKEKDLIVRNSMIVLHLHEPVYEKKDY